MKLVKAKVFNIEFPISMFHPQQSVTTIQISDLRLAQSSQVSQSKVNCIILSLILMFA